MAQYTLSALTPKVFTAPLPVWVLTRTDSHEAQPLLASPQLSFPEQERQARFCVPQARDCFVLGRSLLRHTLALATGQPAAQIRLTLSLAGKPEAPDTSWHFSLSHSGPWVALALARDAIGCDVELGRRLDGKDLPAIARQVFCPAELSALAELAPDPAAQKDFFLSVWRRKEAVLKAAGTGFSGQPRSFSVLACQGKFASVIRYGEGNYHLQEHHAENVPSIALARLALDRPRHPDQKYAQNRGQHNRGE